MNRASQTFHALVVEDSEDILEDVCDRLESLGHTCDCAFSQEQARECLQRPDGYSYVLLDLEIPVKYGRRSRIQNGRNLLQEIRGIPGLEPIPIIVMTSHGKDSPNLAIDVLRHNGADDYVTKPFGSNGRSMEQTILDALAQCGRSRPGARTRSAASPPDRPPQPFEAGELVFYDTHVELCGVKLCGDVHCGVIRRILDLLARKRPNGRRMFFSGEQIANQLELERGQKAVAEAVRD
ncbi:MAG: response regulator, partial [Planctomycetota bacterium]